MIEELYGTCVLRPLLCSNWGVSSLSPAWVTVGSEMKATHLMCKVDFEVVEDDIYVT